jgi:hypothetical protein
MEAVSVVASLVGISTFALQLTKTLYDFGDAITSARDETHRIARNISNYAGVLDLILESLRLDQPLYTQRALRLADSLSEQSMILFGEIKNLVPGSPPWDGVRWRDGTRWAFRKSKVNALVAEVEYLKSTLNLLLQTIILNRQTYLGPDKDGRYTIRAEQALYEQFSAGERLASLEQETEQTQRQDETRNSMMEELGVRAWNRSLASWNDSVLSAFASEYQGSSTSLSANTAKLREDTTVWLARMGAEWFNVDQAESHLLLQLVEADAASEEPRKNDGKGKGKQPEEDVRKEFRELEAKFRSAVSGFEDEIMGLRRKINESAAEVNHSKGREESANRRCLLLEAEHREEIAAITQNRREELKFMQQKLEHDAQMHDRALHQLTEQLHSTQRQLDSRH